MNPQGVLSLCSHFISSPFIEICLFLTPILAFNTHQYDHWPKNASRHVFMSDADCFILYGYARIFIFTRNLVLAKLIMELHDLKLLETGAANEKATSNIIVVRFLHPNYEQSEITSSLTAKLKDGVALTDNESWSQVIKQTPTHNWLTKNTFEGESFIKVQVLHAKEASTADKLAAKIVKAGIDGFLSLMPLGDSIQDGLASGLDKLEFEPKDSEHVIAQGCAKIMVSSSGQIQFYDLDSTPIESIALTAPAKVSTPQRLMNRGAFEGWEKITLIEKDAPNGYITIKARG